MFIHKIIDCMLSLQILRKSCCISKTQSECKKYVLLRFSDMCICIHWYWHWHWHLQCALDRSAIQKSEIRNSELKAQITILRIDFTFIYDGAEENMCVVYVFARHNQSKDDLNWNFQSHIYDVLMWKRGWHPKSYSNPVTLQRKMLWVLV